MFHPSDPKRLKSTAFVLGNGTSRSSVDLNKIKPLGTVYGCNALYREFDPDFLIAVDSKMIFEITKAGYQNQNQVWTNPNKMFSKLENINYFSPSKGWSSGPTALWMASQNPHKEVYILGFDYQGLEDGKRINNVYADTPNYKSSKDKATYYGNWLRQTKTVIKENKKIQYFRVISQDNFCPEELNIFENLETITIEKFLKRLKI